MIFYVVRLAAEPKLQNPEPYSYFEQDIKQISKGASHTIVEEKPFTIKLSFIMPSMDYHIANENQVNKGIDYEQNTGSLLGITVSHNSGFGATINIPPGEPDDKYLYGKTDYLDLVFEFPFDRWQLSAHYSEFEGFYIENPQGIDPNWNPGDPHPQFPDMKSVSYGIDFKYLFAPHRFSIHNFTDQSTIQIASGHSWFVGAKAIHEEYKNKEPFIPTSFLTTFSNNTLNLSQLEYNALIPYLGWAGHWQAYKDFGLSGLISYGYGTAQVKRRLVSSSGAINREKDFADNASNLSLSFLIGWNTPINMYGLRADRSSTDITYDGVEFNSGVSRIYMYYGHRL